MSLLTDLASPLPRPNGCVSAKPEPTRSAHQARDTLARAARRGLRSGVRRSRPRRLLSLSFIYSMIVPLVALDLWISLYQTVCFPLFGIAAVRRQDHFSMDRARLPYLNVMERMHCAYYSYAHGLLSFAGEIAARTERYWCPIKHGRLPADAHDRHFTLPDYSVGTRYKNGAQALQSGFASEHGASSDRWCRGRRSAEETLSNRCAFGSYSAPRERGAEACNPGIGTWPTRS